MVRNLGNSWIIVRFKDVDHHLVSFHFLLFYLYFLLLSVSIFI